MVRQERANRVVKAMQEKAEQMRDTNDGVDFNGAFTSILAREVALLRVDLEDARMELRALREEGKVG